MLLHFTIVGTNSWIFNIWNIGNKLFILPIQGLVFISYPLIGLLADIKLTRYQMICLSCWVLFISHAILSILYILKSIDTIIVYANLTLDVGVILILALAIVGKGMFESTVIQFGTDQMIEASSSQLSTFIHYYWSLYIGNVFIDIIAAGIIVYLSYCHISIAKSVYQYHRITVYKWQYLLLGIPQCCLCCITLLLLYLKKFKNCLNIEPVGVNPVKQIIDVLKYAYHHKYPVRRSALS